MEKNNNYYPQLDSIRAFAVIVVMLCHTEINRLLNLNKVWFNFNGGRYGVELFFVLSGYLITSILVREFVQFNTINRLKFYYRRVLRLYPAIFVALVVFVFPLLYFNKRASFSNGFFLLTYTGDIIPIFLHFFKNLEFPLFFGHTWTLAIEEQFYLIYPIILIYVLRYYKKYNGKKNLVDTFPVFNVIFITIIILCSIILGEKYYKFFAWRFFEIFFGAYIALVYDNLFNTTYIVLPLTKKIRSSIYEIYNNFYINIFAILIFVYFFFFNKDWTFNLNVYLITVASSVLIVNAINSRFKIIDIVLKNRALIYIGRISYGLYLYHYPIFTLFEYKYLVIPVKIQNEYAKAFLNDFVCIILSLMLSILSYEFIEKEFLKLKKRVKNKPQV